MWHVRVTTVAMEMQQCVLCYAELQVIANNIKILSIAQKCLYVEFMSAAKTKVLQSSSYFYPIVTKFGISRHI